MLHILHSNSDAQASEERAAKLATELATVRDELARVSAVAARATVREVGSGSKNEGIIPIVRHLEEVRLPKAAPTSGLQIFSIDTHMLVKMDSIQSYIETHIMGHARRRKVPEWNPCCHQC